MSYTYILNLSNYSIFESFLFLQVDSLMTKFLFSSLELQIALCQFILFSFDLHLPFKSFLLQHTQVLIAISYFAAKLQLLITSSLIFKLCLIKLHETFIRNLGLTIGFLLSHVLPLQLFTLNGFKFINFSNHAVSRGSLILNETLHFLLFLFFLADHVFIAVLQTYIAFLQALEISNLLSKFKCFKLQFRYFEVFIIASTNIFVGMLSPLRFEIITASLHMKFFFFQN